MTTKIYDSKDANLVLFVGGYVADTLSALKLHKDETGVALRPLVFADSKKTKLLRSLKEQQRKDKFELISCNFSSPAKIKETLAPFMDKLAAATVHVESRVQDFQKVIPHIPYLETPTVESLTWATDKIQMRRMFQAQNPKITPKFLVVDDASADTLEKVAKRVGYPVVLKPSGLAGSLLVSVNYHEEELQHNLKKIFRKINKVYSSRESGAERNVLVEQMMEGPMYSIDAYIDSKGVASLCPPVHVQTGKEIGFDDFFGYRRLLPTTLSAESIKAANEVAVESMQALGLRSTSCHIELFRTEKGWKIIELGPRLGGWRHEMYMTAYGINHIVNDVLVRMSKKPIIPKKAKGYSALFCIFPETEGVIEQIKGVTVVNKLASTVSLLRKKRVGDEVHYAKHGGKHTLEVEMFNSDRSELLADIRRMEQAVGFEITPTQVFRKQLQETADALLQPLEEAELLGKKAAKKFKDRIKKDFGTI